MLISATVLLLISRLPLAALYPLSTFLAFLMRVVGYRKHVTEQNLRNSFPELDDTQIRALRRQNYVNLADVIVETAKSFRISEKELRERVRFVNAELMLRLIEQEKAFIVLTSHQCNWEWQLLASSLLGFRVEAAYKKLRNASIDSLMKNMRSRFGAELFESNNFMRSCIRRKTIVRSIGVVGDQRPGATASCEVEFLHQKTRFFTGAEKLATMLHYPVLFMEMRRIKRGYYEIEMKELGTPPYTVENELTKRYAALLEESIRKHPANWLWSHKRWKVVN